jgi:hypothetical protein
MKYEVLIGAIENKGANKQKTNSLIEKRKTMEKT